MIITKQKFSSKSFTTASFITKKQLVEILESSSEFKDELLKVFGYNDKITEVLKIGNAKQLLEAIHLINEQCVKIDITSKVKDIQLLKLLDSEKAIFEIFAIKDDFILRTNSSDLLLAETRYNSKNDILDYYSLAKFANYCRDYDYKDLVNSVRTYLKDKNINNGEQKKLRLVYRNEDRNFFIRAITSAEEYKDFGVNFSVYVALMALSKYVDDSHNEVYIDNFVVDESTVYVSFSFSKKKVIDNTTSLSFSLILENDEIKRNSVSFNGLFKLNVTNGDKASEIYIKPKGLKKDENTYPVDLLSYQHRGTVKNVFEKLKDLSKLIDYFISQVTHDAIIISQIEHPDDVRKFIGDKINRSKKLEFKPYKAEVFKKLMSVTVDNTFKLFELLRGVEELFEHEDVVSLNFWRTKLYEALVERK